MELDKIPYDMESLKRGLLRMMHTPCTSSLDLLISLLDRGVKDAFDSDEDLSDIKFVEDLMGEIKIMALFKILDVSALNAAKDIHKELNLFKVEVDDKGNVKHKHRYAFHEVMHELGINYQVIDGYDSYNEMRLINNAIKHFGFVHDKLAKEYPIHWSYGQELSGLSDHYDRLKMPTTYFYIKVIEQLIPIHLLPA